MLDKNKGCLAFCVFAKQLHMAWDGGDVILPIENNRLETVLFDTLSVILGKSAARGRGPINCIVDEMFETKMEKSSDVLGNGSSVSSCALAEDDGIRDIIIPAGPAPFTQLRILRAVQLGLATGLKCAAPMVNMFDVLFAGAAIDTGTCLLETRRGDYFLQTRIEGKITDEGVSTTVILDKVRQHRDRGPISYNDTGSSNSNAKYHYSNVINGSSIWDVCVVPVEDDSSKYTAIISDDPKLSTAEITKNLAKTMLENDWKLCEELIYGIKLPYSTKGMIM